jgi:hypothetical protein
MKRTILAAALFLAGALGAQADVDGWKPMTKNDSDASMYAASAACEQQLGPNLNDVPTSLQFKRCMARRGWRYQYTRHEPAWIDPDTGLRRHNTGFASVCS